MNTKTEYPTNAASVEFGWDFQHNAGIMIMLMNIKDAKSIKIEGKSEDKIEYFNLGTGTGVSVLELVNTFMEATGVNVPYKIVGRREGDIEKIWGNPTRANEVLGWKATQPLAETLANAWRWQLKLRERGVM